MPIPTTYSFSINFSLFSFRPSFCLYKFRLEFSPANRGINIHSYLLILRKPYCSELTLSFLFSLFHLTYLLITFEFIHNFSFHSGILPRSIRYKQNVALGFLFWSLMRHWIFYLHLLAAYAQAIAYFRQVN